MRGQLGFRHSLSKAGAPRRGRKDGPGHAVRILHVSEFSPTRTSHSAAGPARPSRAPSGLTAHAPVTLSDVSKMGLTGRDRDGYVVTSTHTAVRNSPPGCTRHRLGRAAPGGRDAAAERGPGGPQDPRGACKGSPLPAPGGLSSLVVPGNVPHPSFPVSSSDSASLPHRRPPCPRPAPSPPHPAPPPPTLLHPPPLCTKELPQGPLSWGLPLQHCPRVPTLRKQTPQPGVSGPGPARSP